MTKKSYIILALVVVLFAACADEKAKEKALLDEVIKIHDEVMGKEEYLMRNRMKMDTILTNDTLKKKFPVDEIIVMGAMRSKMMQADRAMSTWMERFDVEQKGKSHEEKVKYFNEQKRLVLLIDSQMTVAIEASDKYLKEIKK